MVHYILLIFVFVTLNVILLKKLVKDNDLSFYTCSNTVFDSDLSSVSNSVPSETYGPI